MRKIIVAALVALLLSLTTTAIAGDSLPGGSARFWIAGDSLPGGS